MLIHIVADTLCVADRAIDYWAQGWDRTRPLFWFNIVLYQTIEPARLGITGNKVRDILWVDISSLHSLCHCI
jgi:hypothetical protein